jgi:hypothetical protein
VSDPARNTTPAPVTIEQARPDEDTHQWIARLHRENAAKAAQPAPQTTDWQAEAQRLRRLLARAEAALAGTVDGLRDGPVRAPPLMIEILREVREGLAHGQ